MTRNNSRTKPIDDVERMRQVRRQIECEHPTLESLYGWLEEMDQQRITREKQAANKKLAVKKTTTRKRAQARTRS